MLPLLVVDRAGDPVGTTGCGRGTLEGTGVGFTIGWGTGGGSHGKEAHLEFVRRRCQVYQCVSTM